MDERARDYYYSLKGRKEGIIEKGLVVPVRWKVEYSWSVTAGQLTEQRVVLIMGNETRLREKRACVPAGHFMKCSILHFIQYAAES